MTGSEARARMLAGLPITERVLDVGGVETTVLEAGDGPPLVLLHGGIECGGAYWAPVITRLAETNRLVVPDVPGLGESAPVDRLDDDTFAAWFTGVLEQTHAEQPTLVAHSLLGSAAARFAARRSDLLRGLVVYGAPGVGPYRMPMRLRYVAIRFGIRPSRAQRRTVRPLRAPRPRRQPPPRPRVVRGVRCVREVASAPCGTSSGP